MVIENPEELEIVLSSKATVKDVEAASENSSDYAVWSTTRSNSSKTHSSTQSQRSRSSSPSFHEDDMESFGSESDLLESTWIIKNTNTLLE